MSPRSTEAEQTQSAEQAEQDAARDVTVAIDAAKKAIQRKEKLVAKRREMLDAAAVQLEKAQYKVQRRTEILSEHEDELEALKSELGTLEASR